LTKTTKKFINPDFPCRGRKHQYQDHCLSCLKNNQSLF